MKTGGSAECCSDWCERKKFQRRNSHWIDDSKRAVVRHAQELGFSKENSGRDASVMEEANAASEDDMNNFNLKSLMNHTSIIKQFI
jgi:hypothetical protein